VRAGLRGLAAVRTGRAALGLCVVLLGAGLVAAGARVVSAGGDDAFALAPDAGVPDTWPRLDREAPRLGLVDQHGEPLDLERLAGRPALVTFAFGHCETVCPLVVRQTVEAQQRVAGRAAAGAAAEEDVPRVVVVTLDPWRDTPTRLRHIATHWKATQETFVLSGDVETVNGVLDAWNVARRRDPQTGDVTHPPLVYVLDPAGRIAYAASGGVETLVELLGRSRGSREHARAERL